MSSLSDWDDYFQIRKTNITNSLLYDKWTNLILLLFGDSNLNTFQYKNEDKLICYCIELL